MVLNTLDFLQKQDLENIKKYRNTSSGFTFIERWVYEPYWDFVANNLPDVSKTFILVSDVAFHHNLSR